jgi:hypothetical protein
MSRKLILNYKRETEACFPLKAITLRNYLVLAPLSEGYPGV